MTDEPQVQAATIYSVALKITHTTEDPAVISRELGLQPDYGWKAGQPRTAPNGAPLPGINRETYWAFVQEVENHRRFFETVVQFIERLEAAEEYVRALLASGGRARLSISLSGQINIGDSFAASDLGRMARLGVALDVEVFPNMQ